MVNRAKYKQYLQIFCWEIPWPKTYTCYLGAMQCNHVTEADGEILNWNTNLCNAELSDGVLLT
jgi:hypothetical protein